jgi:hypothetical protein
MYEVLYSARQSDYDLSIMSFLIDGRLVTSINYVPSSASTGVFLGDSILTTTNTTFGQYFGLLQHGVQFLASGYVSSQNATLWTLGNRYLTITHALNTLQHFVQQSPISPVTVTESSTLVIDSAATCLTCEASVGAAIVAGCFALCFFSGGALCMVCTALVDMAIVEGSEAACAYIHWCP